MPSLPSINGAVLPFPVRLARLLRGGGFLDFWQVCHFLRKVPVGPIIAPIGAALVATLLAQSGLEEVVPQDMNVWHIVP